MSSFIIGWCSQHENSKKKTNCLVSFRKGMPPTQVRGLCPCSHAVSWRLTWEQNGIFRLPQKMEIKGWKCCKFGSLSFSRWKKTLQLLYNDGNLAVPYRTMLRAAWPCLCLQVGRAIPDKSRQWRCHLSAAGKCPSRAERQMLLCSHGIENVLHS